MHVLITGASGFVGSIVVERCPEDYSAVGLSRKRGAQKVCADLSTLDHKDLVDLLHLNSVKAIIHLAAESNLSRCEQNPEAHLINVQATKRLTGVAKNLDIPIVFSSSDQVFSGGPHELSETSIPSPKHEYGRQKLKGEQIITGYSKGVVLRLPLVVGRHNQGLGSFETMYAQGKREGRLSLFFDEFRRPIHVYDAAMALWKAINWPSGIYHVTGPETLSRLELMNRLLSTVGENNIVIEAVSQSKFSFEYARPKRLVLISEKKEVKNLQIRPIDHHKFNTQNTD